MKHTAGPWDLYNDTGAHQFIDKLVALPDNDDANYNIFNIRHGAEIPKQERQANAQLITTAPELLEVLEEITEEFNDISFMGWLDKFYSDIGEEETGQIYALIGRAQSIVAKAKGL